MNRRKWIALSVTALFALAGGPLLAQDHDRDHGREEHKKFDDHDHDAMRDWYHNHHEHPPRGFRDQDRLPPEFERQLAVGFVLTPEFRRRIVACPDDLCRRFPAPPRGYRYVVIGGHVCLVDRDWRVADLVHFELDFHF
jgi:Ni/Co efflux regulator RcnB